MVGNEKSGNRTHIRIGRKAVLCPHGILGKSKCKLCLTELKRKGKPYIITNRISVSEKRCTKCGKIITKKTYNNSWICKECWIGYWRERSERAMEERNRKASEKLGKVCKVCGSKENIIYHEIHGLPHRVNDVLKRPEDFIALCCGCHLHITKLYYKADPELAIKLIRLGYRH
jgi:hypothetical protein